MPVFNSSGTLAAGTGAQLAAGRSDLKLLIICNTGLNPMVAKFGSLPTSATDGFPLDPATAAGGQGGSLMLAVEDAPGDFAPPADALYGMSAAGTTFSVVQEDGAYRIAPFAVRHGAA
jgi:hypothetical protein